MFNVKIKYKSGLESTLHVADATMKTPADAAAHVKRMCGDSVEILGAEPSGKTDEAAPVVEEPAK